MHVLQDEGVSGAGVDDGGHCLRTNFFWSPKDYFPFLMFNVLKIDEEW